MQKVFLVRHGEPLLKEKICLGGILNPPLSEKGIQQMNSLSFIIKQENISAVYSSPMLRCTESAEVICKGKKILIASQLSEIQMGIFEGLTFKQIREKYPLEYERRGADIFNYAPLHGESFSDCLIRAKKELEHIFTQELGNILIVAHAGINRALIYDIGKRNKQGMLYKSVLDIPQGYGCVNCIVKYEDKIHIEYVGKFF